MATKAPQKVVDEAQVEQGARAEWMRFILTFVAIVQPIALAWIVYQQVALGVQVKNVGGTVKEVGAQVEKVEKNTNHLVSVLVEKTEESSHAQGVADEKARQGDDVPNRIVPHDGQGQDASP